VDVWILAAANEDLTAAMAARRFRPDSYDGLATLILPWPDHPEAGWSIRAVLRAEAADSRRPCRPHQRGLGWSRGGGRVTGRAGQRTAKRGQHR
jgi:hypothetical protein